MNWMVDNYEIRLQMAKPTLLSIVLSPLKTVMVAFTLFSVVMKSARKKCSRVFPSSLKMISNMGLGSPFWKLAKFSTLLMFLLCVRRLSAKTISDVLMNSLTVVIPLHFTSWEKTPNDIVTPQRQSQFTPKMKANVVPRLLSSLVWIDQYNECNRMTSFMEFM